MKTRKRMYICMVACQEIRRRRNYAIRNAHRDRAWRKAFDKFVGEFPQVLERGLSAGGEVLILSQWQKAHREALAATSSRQLFAPSRADCYESVVK